MADSMFSRAEIEQDLLQLVLQEQVQYPWNLAESEAFFAGIEAATADEWETGELAARGQAIASQLDSLWTAIDQTAAHSQVATLFARVAGRVPQQIIAGIVQRSQQLVTSNLSLTERMVQCVQDFVADCNPEDLLLTSRKFAVVRSSSTRSRGTANGFVDTALQQVRETDWSDLSAGEQAFLSLAIAHAALTEEPKVGE